jgi:hypothetical protein
LEWRRARETLVTGNVPTMDPYYRMVLLTEGNIIFARETGASKEEKLSYYGQAVLRYKDAADVFPDDPRPLLYQGLCYERLTDIAGSPQEKQRMFALSESAL